MYYAVVVVSRSKPIIEISILRMNTFFTKSTPRFFSTTYYGHIGTNIWLEGMYRLCTSESNKIKTLVACRNSNRKRYKTSRNYIAKRGGSIRLYLIPDETRREHSSFSVHSVNLHHLLAVREQRSLSSIR